MCPTGTIRLSRDIIVSKYTDIEECGVTVTSQRVANATDATASASKLAYIAKFLDDYAKSAGDGKGDVLVAVYAVPGAHDSGKSTMLFSSMRQNVLPAQAQDATRGLPVPAAIHSSMASGHNIPAMPVLEQSTKDNDGEYPTAKSRKRRHRCTVSNCTHKKAWEDGYANKEDLDKHVRTRHTDGGRGLFPCSFCHKKYDHRRSLNKHLNDKHNGKGVKSDFKFQCPTCNARYGTKKECDEHVQEQACTLISTHLQEQACTPISGVPVAPARKRRRTMSATKTSEREKNASPAVDEFDAEGFFPLNNVDESEFEAFFPLNDFEEDALEHNDFFRQFDLHAEDPSFQLDASVEGLRLRSDSFCLLSQT